MKMLIVTLLIGTIFAVACASSAPRKFRSLQDSLQGSQEGMQVQFQTDNDYHDNVVEKALPYYIQQKIATMQDDDDDVQNHPRN